MRKNYRIVGLGIWVILIFGLAGSVYAANNDRNPNTQVTQSLEMELSQSSSSAQPLAYQYPYSCERPKSVEQDNLCVARQAADAAVASAFWTKATVYVGVAGTISILITLIISVISTFIAIHSAKLAKETLISTQRAYIYAEDIRAFWEVDGKTKQYNWRFRPVWKNSGNTVTMRMRMHSECRVVGAILPAGFDFNYATDAIGNAIIHPNTDTMGGVAPLPPASPITPQNILDAQSGKAIIYFWGWARYFDILDKRTEHITRFCWQVVPVGDPVKKPTELKWDRIYHAEGNTADEG